MNGLPPDPQNAALKRIYPWDQYDKTLVMRWLYAQAKATGFTGTFEDFKERYGAMIEAANQEELYTLIDNYTGTYRIKPLVSIDQVLHTKNKVLNQDIIVEGIAPTVVPQGEYSVYTGQYEVTPIAYLDQMLRTKNTVLEDNIVIEKIPIHQVDNAAGGRTVTIG